jgi:hypothetical protein
MRLGIVVVVCALLLAGCGPKQEISGRVIVGKDENGTLVAVVGYCVPDLAVDITVRRHDPAPMPTWTTPPSTFSNKDYFQMSFTARYPESSEVMRLELRPGRPPAGWTEREGEGEGWGLPDTGKVTISASIARPLGGFLNDTSYLPEDAEIDLGAVPPLPADAAERAVDNCVID